MLKARLRRDDFLGYVCRQIDNIFPDGHAPRVTDISAPGAKAFEWYRACCEGLTRKYFTDGSDTLLSHTNTDQYAMFLYMLSHELFLIGDLEAAERVYSLNKALHAIDVFYSVKMPEKFMFSHCVGTVLGHAQYSNYFRAGQNCTVGTEGGKQPVFGVGVALYKGAIVSGDVVIGNNVHVSAHCFVRRTRIPNDVVVFGSSGGDIDFKATKLSVKQRFFYSGHSGGVGGDWFEIQG